MTWLSTLRKLLSKKTKVVHPEKQALTSYLFETRYHIQNYACRGSKFPDKEPCTGYNHLVFDLLRFHVVIERLNNCYTLLRNCDITAEAIGENVAVVLVC